MVVTYLMVLPSTAQQVVQGSALQCRSKTEKIDYEAIAALAKEHKPKIIIAGYSSIHGYLIMQNIANCRQCWSLFMADISHIAGITAQGNSFAYWLRACYHFHYS